MAVVGRYGSACRPFERDKRDSDHRVQSGVSGAWPPLIYFRVKDLRMRRSLLLVGVLGLGPGLISAQTETGVAHAAVTQAADSITAEGIARHVSVMADDSMMGRDTPSPGLAKTAQYIAEQFKKLGLGPFGDTIAGSPEHKRTWFQRYPTPGSLTLNSAMSQVSFYTQLRKGGKPIVDEGGGALSEAAAITFDNGARFAVDTVPQFGARADFGGRAVVVSGRQTPATLQQAKLENKVVLYIPAPDADSALQRKLIDQLYVSNHVLALSDEDSAGFALRQLAAASHPPLVVDGVFEDALDVHYWAAYVRLGMVKDFLKSAGLDLTQVRTDTAPRMRELSTLNIGLDLRFAEQPKDTTTAMNVVGVLPGVGEKFRYLYYQYVGERDRYIVISAHMDHTGLSRGQADSINNGANDNASGIAVLLELAKAFSQTGARPRRTIIFLATSGGGKERWGSSHALEGEGSVIRGLAENYPTMNINLDMLGRSPGDSVLVSGLYDLDWPVRPDWIAGQHPELRLTVADGGTVVNATSDHFEFVRRRIPSLYFHNDSHTAPAVGPDSPAAVDADAAARIAKLVFFVTYALGNTEKSAAWSATGRMNRLRELGE